MNTKSCFEVGIDRELPMLSTTMFQTETFMNNKSCFEVGIDRELSMLSTTMFQNEFSSVSDVNGL